MPNPQKFEHPEPVPPVSQLCALSFVSGVTGYLVDTLSLPEVRVTLHRSMTRDGKGYLQQLCAYGPVEASLDHRAAGRMFTVTTGIMGKAYADLRVVRTRRYASEKDWRAHHRADCEKLGEVSTPEDRIRSYLAVPFLAPSGGTCVCVLYVEVSALNAFVEGNSLQGVMGMCHGFRRLLDGLDSSPLPKVRNYPLPQGEPFRAQQTVYPRLQEALDNLAPPQFEHLPSLNLAPSL